MVFTLGTTRDEGTGDLGLNQLLVADWRERNQEVSRSNAEQRKTNSFLEIALW